MCGIAGIRKMEGGHAIMEWQIDTLLTSLEYRGLDASGVALQQASGEIAVYKDNKPAWSFVKLDGFKKFLKEQLREDTLTVLCHTRKATKGSPFQNKNNQQMCSGLCAVTHNGGISNDDELFREYKLERGAETDSDILRAIIDAHGITKKVVEKLAKVSGTVAAAAIHPKYPGKVLLLRSGNPLVIGSSQKFGHLIWASDKRSIYRVSKPWVNRWNFLMQIPASDVAFLNMYDNSGYIVGDKGLEWHDAFKIQGTYGRGYLQYHVYGGDYAERQRGFRAKDDAKAREEARRSDPPRENAGTSTAVSTESVVGAYLSPRIVICPSLTCTDSKGRQTLLKLRDSDRLLPLHRLQCKKCKANLAEAEVKLAAKPN